MVLRRRNVGEADAILTLLCPESGRFDAVARGVRKPRSHMRGHLEPLTRVRLLLARSRGLPIVTQAETVTSYSRVKESLEVGAAALYCAELAERLTAEDLPNPAAFALLVELLDALENSEPLHVVRWYELHLLGCSGYAPQLDSCAACGGRLPEEETLLSPAMGGLVCRDCRGTAGAGRLLSVRAIKVLRFAARSGSAATGAIRIDPGLARELDAALRDQVRQVLDRDPRSRRYIEELAALPPVASRDEIGAHPASPGVVE